MGFSRFCLSVQYPRDLMLQVVFSNSVSHKALNLNRFRVHFLGTISRHQLPTLSLTGQNNPKVQSNRIQLYVFTCVSNIRLYPFAHGKVAFPFLLRPKEVTGISNNEHICRGYVRYCDNKQVWC
ncbi:hypothetical protein AQUCO_00201241v1 [Aquilegia coerulea]|uniref:Uncharacterized protein n=1 Tax=Aquilegia coerulea TaxID=218851 RepID=A0A2G5F6W0_AQUCA|nr:hypothetical protein AQUCO_00201241v1 [Aquilegia coerulea]